MNTAPRIDCVFSFCPRSIPKHGSCNVKDREKSRSNMLILETDRDTGELFARALETHRGCKCYMASDEAEAMSLLKDIPFHLLIADLEMLMATDFSLLKRIKKSFPEMMVLAAGYIHQKVQMSLALSHGADGSITKPIQVNLFRRQIDAFCFPEMSSTP